MSGDRRDGDRRKLLVLPAVALIGRFLTHGMPAGLMRIRHYGFLANRFKQARLTTIRQLLGAAPKIVANKGSDWLTQWLETILGTDPERCPCCGERLQTNDSAERITFGGKAWLKAKPNQRFARMTHQSKIQ